MVQQGGVLPRVQEAAGVARPAHDYPHAGHCSRAVEEGSRSRAQLEAEGKKGSEL